MKMKTFAAMTLVALSALGLNSCETATGTGALVGAGAGALIGSGGPHGHGSRGDTVAGAAIGAGVGALVGAAIDADSRGYYEGHEADYYPYGRRTERRGIVRSPYPPNALVDVRGIPRGALVRDPGTGRPFRKP